MPLYSIWKRLVGAEDPATPTAAAAAASQLPGQPPHEEQHRPPPPPAMPPKATGPATSHSTASMASLRSQVESERQAASSSSVYRDFTGAGHADAGHWNDPPTVVFKPHNKQPKPKPKDQEPLSASESPFMIVDGAVTPNGTVVAEAKAADSQPGATESLVCVPEDTQEQAAVLQQALRQAVASIDIEAASPMTRRMIEDTHKRLQVLDERLSELSPQLTAAVCMIALLVDQGLLTEAADAHRDLMQAGYDSELRWLVGIKRVIELRQKAT